MRELIQQAFEFDVSTAKRNAEKSHEFRALDLVKDYQESDIYDQYYMYSAFALTSLPHKKPGDGVTSWTHSNGQYKLMVEGGSNFEGDEAVYAGIPYGSRARLILYYLVSNAVEKQDPRVHLGSTMTAWMKSMKIPTSGGNYDLVREQVKRITSCRLSFVYSGENGEALSRQNIVGMMFTPRGGGKQVWQETAVLSDAFFNQLMSHKFPIDARAISVLQNQSQAMDVYIWLCYRLNKLKDPLHIPWKSLYQQFGAGYSELRFFKRKFKQEILPRALCVYPKANVTVDDATGLILEESPPALDFVKTYRGGRIKAIPGGGSD